MKKAILIVPLFFFSKFFSQFNTVSYQNDINNIKISPITENHFGGNFLSYHIEGKVSRKKGEEKNQKQETQPSSNQSKESTVPESASEPKKNNKETEFPDMEEGEDKETLDKRTYYRKLKLITENNYAFTEKQFVYMPLKKMMITSGYGGRFHPVDKVNKFHAGVDLRANGDYVFAVMDGIVSESGNNAGAGNYIKIRHKDFETVYMHLSKIFYSKGDIIYSGDIIALSGNTGKSTAPHLHFAVKENGKYINPVQFLNDLIQTNNALADYNNGN